MMWWSQLAGGSPGRCLVDATGPHGCELSGVFVIEPLEEMLSRTATPRKPSAGSGPGACCRSKIEDFRDDERAKLSRTTLLAPLQWCSGARVPGPHLALSVLQVSTAPQPCPSLVAARKPLPAGRMRSGQDDVIRAGRRESGRCGELIASAGRRRPKGGPPNERTGSEATRERVSSRERRGPLVSLVSEANEGSGELALLVSA